MKVLVLQHESCETLGVFEEELQKRDIQSRYVKVYEEAVPKSFKGFSKIIILGGPMNVYEEETCPFLRAEDVLIKEALKKRVPLLGICLGSQLIAKAAGAKVRKGPEKEIGWYTIRLTEEGKRDRLFNRFKDEFKVFHWHGDTFDLPAGAVPLAENDLYLQAFRLESAYALQFHLEVTEEMIKDWLSRYEDEVRSLKGFIDPGKIIVDTERHAKDLNKSAKMFIEKWLNESGGPTQSI